MDPDSNAAHVAASLRATRPGDAALLDKIAKRPQATWVGDWFPDVRGTVAGFVRKAFLDDALPVFVLYNIPNRDCGQYSAGGVKSSGEYRGWVRDVARGIGTRPAVVILEPDALGLLDRCLAAKDQTERLEILRDAVRVLRTSQATAVYLDAGNAKWLKAAEMAGRLERAGVSEADGFALNVSNYVGTADSVAYGKAISARLAGKHFVIDTSRNGNGPTPDLQWCNPDGRALGEPPTIETADPLVDAYLWIKRPGESDGTCNGGPRAGEFWTEQAIGLARRARF